MTTAVHTAEDLSAMLIIFEKWAKEYGMVFNVKKSEVLIFFSHKMKHKQEDTLKLYNTSLNIVQELKYLGIFYTKSGKPNKHI